MELNNKKYEDIIVEIITKNERYPGNEDLLKFIYDDVILRLGNILDTITDEAIAKSYIERIVKLAVISIIKKRPLLIAQISGQAPDKRNIRDDIDYYSIFACKPLKFNEATRLTAQQISEFKKGITALSNEHPNKNYIKLYRLRYIENKTLEEISDELNVSQAQGAEQLFEIAALIKRIRRNEVSQV